MKKFIAIAAACIATGAGATGAPPIKVYQPEHHHDQEKTHHHAHSTRSHHAQAAHAGANSNSRSSARTHSSSSAVASAAPSSASATTSDANNSRNTLSYQAERAPVSTAYAPSINPTVNCSAVLSGGAQGVGFGLSVGGSKIDERCQREELAKTVAQLGDFQTAHEILCEDSTYRAARARVGRPCAPIRVTEEEKRVYSGADPIVRARLGLPPLKN